MFYELGKNPHVELVSLNAHCSFNSLFENGIIRMGKQIYSNNGFQIGLPAGRQRELKFLNECSNKQKHAVAG